MAVFTLMRHGEAAFDAFSNRELIGGCNDWVPLTPKGIKQIESRAEQWRDHSFELILASPMTRALQTAAILSRRLDLPMQVEFDLHEWLPDLTFRYTTYEQVQQAMADRDRSDREWPAGEQRTWEPFSQVRKRTRSVLERYDDKRSVLVACHHTLVLALAGRSLELAQWIQLDLSK